MIIFGAIIEKIVVAFLGGTNDHELAFMFLYYLSHFQMKFGDYKSYELLEDI